VRTTTRVVTVSFTESVDERISVQQAVNKLDDRLRDVVVGIVCNGETVHMVAQRYGVCDATVRRWRKRAYEKLRQLLS
jgi:RNA polymerase sigma factor (sigma-70 family)